MKRILKTGEDFNEMAYAMSLHTRLIEALEWDEDKAVKYFKDALDVFLTLYEYCKYDKEMIKDEEDYRKLFRANFPHPLTDEQFEALDVLVRYKVQERIKNSEQEGE
jgi:predicted house-cleaning noncanonical NTP pyrophosphatase (MazG superfamily)